MRCALSALRFSMTLFDLTKVCLVGFWGTHQFDLFYISTHGYPPTLLWPKPHFDFFGKTLLRPKLYFSTNKKSRFDKRSKYRGRSKEVEVQKRPIWCVPGFSTKISIFYQIIDFWPQFRFSTTLSIFDQNLYFWPKFKSLTKFDFRSKFRFLTKSLFLPKILIFE